MAIQKHLNDSVYLNDGNWDDLRVAAQNTRINPVKEKPDYGSLTGAFLTYLFDPAETETVNFVIQIPHSFKYNSTIYPHVHWAPVTASSGSVRWSFEYSIANIFGTFGAATTLTALCEASGTAYKHFYCSLGSIDMSGFSTSCMILCNLSRLGNGSGDDYPSDAGLLEFDIHYQKNCIGSDNELNKSWE